MIPGVIAVGADQSTDAILAGCAVRAVVKLFCCEGGDSVDVRSGPGSGKVVGGDVPSRF